MACQVRCRLLRHPLGAPWTNGELANMATRTGKRVCSRDQRCAAPVDPAASVPASSEIWSDAVEHIMVRPAEPKALKCRSMAAYRGWSSDRTAGRPGSRASDPKQRPAFE